MLGHGAETTLKELVPLSLHMLVGARQYIFLFFRWRSLTLPWNRIQLFHDEVGVMSQAAAQVAITSKSHIVVICTQLLNLTSWSALLHGPLVTVQIFIISYRLFSHIIVFD